ncbi:unnamed protein product [Microthlaspi erraticum]|uniref:F-box domain-containing protein n=1 Tax=Microthlaspi erraticum TaxID=1685480 RepID=A0A6D2HK17_9BRAS|nr:unnamed protein product [Microthlaspi erraticum]
MKTMSDIPGDVVEEILSRLPLISLRAVRSTCKMWNALSKKRILGGESAKKQFLGFMMMDYKVCSMKFDLQGIRNDDEEVFVDPCIKQVSLLEKVEISKAFHCDGLLLCVIKDSLSLVLWNPYLGQIRWIQPRNSFHRLDRYALGYDENRNHKILRVFGDYESSRSQVSGYEVYDLSSDSWKTFDFDVSPDWDIQSHQRGVSLKGNVYFLALEKTRSGREFEAFLLCFDFTAERFGPRLPMPFQFFSAENFVSLSCVREEQVAVLYQNWEDLEIQVNNLAGSFFIDEEENVAVVFDLDRHKHNEEACRYQTAYILGQDGYFKSVNIAVAPNLRTSDKFGCRSAVYCRPLVCSSSYVPNLVQLHIDNKLGKRKEEGHD